LGKITLATTILLQHEVLFISNLSYNFLEAGDTSLQQWETFEGIINIIGDVNKDLERSVGEQFPFNNNQGQNLTSWSESTSDLYRPNDCHFSAKLVPTFADRGCPVVSATDTYCCILDFLDRSRYFFFQAAPQLYSRG
jgi:hypothetical protein